MELPVTTPLAAYLDRKKLTYEEFAAASGVSASYLCRIATGQRDPRISILRRIVAATGGELSMEDMLA